MNKKLLFIAWTISDVKLLRALTFHSNKKVTIIALRLSSFCYAKYCKFSVVGLWHVPFLASFLFWRKTPSGFNIDKKFYLGLSIKDRYFESAFKLYRQVLGARFPNYESIVFLTGTSRLSEQAIQSHFSSSKIIYWEAGIAGTIYMSEKGVNADADFRDLPDGEHSYFAQLFSQTCQVDEQEKIPKKGVIDFIFKVFDGLYLVFLRYLLGNKEVDEILDINWNIFSGKKQAVELDFSLNYNLFVDQVEQDTNFTHFGNNPVETVRYLNLLMEKSGLNETSLLVRRGHPRQLVTLVSKILKNCSSTNYIDDSGSNLTQSLINANLIITVNSTVGVEALLLGKPVVLLGASYYDKLYGVLSPEEGIRFSSGLLDLDSEKIIMEVSRFLDNCFIPIDYRRGKFRGIHGFDDFLAKLDNK